MRKIIDFLHSLTGHFICRLFMLYFSIRDFINRPKEKAVLFVTHPDDDTLFFHEFIKKNKPYVVLCTTGYAIRRANDFARNMRHYGVRYRFYDLSQENDDYKHISKIANRVFKLGNFDVCATHGPDGEYGHHCHKCTSKGVIDALGSKVKILVPANETETKKHPLPLESVNEKMYIYNNFYQTQLFCPEVWPQWFENEYLTDIKDYYKSEKH